jgi:transposase InsO family protein
VVEGISLIRHQLPFALRGLDTDNDSAFMNETLQSYCREHQLEWTRSRAYRKNDQAWVEQKNGAVVRRLAGYGRLSGGRRCATRRAFNYWIDGRNRARRIGNNKGIGFCCGRSCAAPI